MTCSSSKPRVVAFNHFSVYPPRTGGGVRVFEILRNLVQHGCSVKLYAYGESTVQRASGVEMCSIPKPWPSLVQLGGLMCHAEGRIAIDTILSVHPKLSATAEEDVRVADIVQTEHLWASLFPLILARRNGKPSVFDDHNAEYLLAERSYTALGTRARCFQPLWAKVVKDLEGTCCMLADVIVVTSEDDRQHLSKTFGVSCDKIYVVENGVNTDEIYPSDVCRSRIRKAYGLHESDPVLLFLGKYDYPPNRYTAEFIVGTLAPIVFARHPNARIFMVGRDPPVYLANDPRIIWTGEVENVMPYINACDISLAPIPLGSGTRLKVLSYLACDRPVVATPAALEGLSLKDGQHVLISDLKNFPATVVRLLEDCTARTELGAGASIFIKSNYDWKATTSKLVEIYDHIC